LPNGVIKEIVYFIIPSNSTLSVKDPSDFAVHIEDPIFETNGYKAYETA